MSTSLMDTVFSRCFNPNLFFPWLVKLSVESFPFFLLFSSCSCSISRFRLASSSGSAASLLGPFRLSCLGSLPTAGSWMTSGFGSFLNGVSWLMCWILASMAAASLIWELLLSLVSDALLRLSFFWVCGELGRLFLSLLFLFSFRLVFSPEGLQEELDWEPWDDNQPRENSFSRSFAEGSPETHKKHTGLLKHER